MPVIFDTLKPLSPAEKKAVRARLDAGEKPASIAFDLRVPELWVRRIADGCAAYRKAVAERASPSVARRRVIGKAPGLAPNLASLFKPEAMRISKPSNAACAVKPERNKP